MSLFDKFKAQFKDVVQWEDNSDDTLVFKFQRADTALKNGSVLTVHPSQQAVMVSKGIAGSVYEPGSYTLDTDNKMFLTDLQSWGFMFNSPWIFELYFFSSKIFSGFWGSTNPQGIYMHCQEMGDVYFKANGGYSFRITDPIKLMTQLSASEDVYSLEEFEKQVNLKVIIAGKVEEMFASVQTSARQLSAQRAVFAEQLQQYIQPTLQAVGIELIGINFANIAFDDQLAQSMKDMTSKNLELQQEIREIIAKGNLSGQQINNLNTLRQGEAVVNLSQNEGDVGGMMGMGLGYAMINNMGQQFNQQQQQVLHQAQQSGATPPPLPGASVYFVAANGMQTGPFPLPVLQQMVQQGTLNNRSLIWTQGMASWVAAEEVVELAMLFNTNPPPIP